SFSRDWSSDVCSSDLAARKGGLEELERLQVVAFDEDVAWDGCRREPERRQSLARRHRVSVLIDQDAPGRAVGQGQRVVFAWPAQLQPLPSRGLPPAAQEPCPIACVTKCGT